MGGYKMRLLLAAVLVGSVCAFTAPTSIARASVSAQQNHRAAALAAMQDANDGSFESNLKNGALATALAVALMVPSASAQAYVPSDYASETVQEAVETLKNAAGNKDETFKAYESIASIITEGKGVGGQINYQGIALERGYIADEDTTIYNPGLSLLTESEKERLVDAVINARRVGVQLGQWNDDNELGFQFLREKLDPYHMNELSGFLGFVPFYGAFLYLVALAVQQNARELFTTAYFVGVAAFFLPILALISFGPQ